MHGPGTIPEIRTKHRVRLDMGKVEHFVEFINRPYFYQDVSYGNKVLTLDNNDRIEMPNVVRMPTRSTMIEQYLEYCKEQCHEPLIVGLLCLKYWRFEKRLSVNRSRAQTIRLQMVLRACRLSRFWLKLLRKEEWKNSGDYVFAKTYAMLYALSKLTTVCTVKSITLLALTTVESLRLVILLIPSSNILVRITINRLASSAKG